MKFSELQRLQRREGITVLSSDARIEQLEARLCTITKERDALQAKIEAMNGCLPYGAIAKILTEVMDIATANGANSVSMPDEYVEVAAWLQGIPAEQIAPGVPECPYPCGWRNLLKLAIEDGAYLARHINEDEPVTENARFLTMLMVSRLRDVLVAVINAAPEAKP